MGVQWGLRADDGTTYPLDDDVPNERLSAEKGRYEAKEYGLNLTVVRREVGEWTEVDQ